MLIDVRLQIRGIMIGLILMTGSASAAIITFSDSDFVTTPVFSNVQTFDFSIDIAGPLAPGIYDDPILNGVEYSVFRVTDARHAIRIFRIQSATHDLRR